MIEVHNITKQYSKSPIPAIQDISFQVNNAEIFGLIGPDGAGKTTLFRVLTTLLLPDKGYAMVQGLDVVKDYKKLRRMMGYMPGKFSLYPDLSVEENLRFFATIFNTTIEQNYTLIKDIYQQLEPFNKRRASNLSGGMKQKLALCCALIHEPTVLFLDEPTTGVDPVSRKEFWEMLQKLKRQGITILVSTPYMDEATQCDRIAFIQNGKILQIDSPHHISTSFKDKVFAVKANKTAALLKSLQQYPDRLNSYGFGEYAHLIVSNSKEGRQEQAIRQWLENSGLTQVEIKETPATIEDSFIKLLS